MSRKLQGKIECDILLTHLGLKGAGEEVVGYQTQGSPVGDWLKGSSDLQSVQPVWSQGDKCSNFTFFLLSLQCPVGTLHWPNSTKAKGKEACWCNSFRSALWRKKQVDKEEWTQRGKWKTSSTITKELSIGEEEDILLLKSRGEENEKQKRRETHKTQVSIKILAKNGNKFTQTEKAILCNPDLVPFSLYHILEKKERKKFMLAFLIFSFCSLTSSE